MEHLNECRARVDRALEHLEALRSARANWRGMNIGIADEPVSGSGWIVTRAKYVEPPPLQFGIFASDYIHQLRAALDNLVCALAKLNGAPVTRAHAFPTTHERKDWKGAVNGRLKGLRQDHVDEIESVQPFTLGADADAPHPQFSMNSAGSTNTGC